ncbi:MAG TPA: DNA mismatch repair endonuclease MutL [Ignavibacteriales bacterium]|nr:DNA mismatch repair endonuclease MutL [Ignavibacteriales bacterium]
MAKIKILPDNIANKIAAGEVVQRPENVVKELVENSIDANATKITVLIKNAGKSLIQIIDNGTGMLEEDAILSIQKHATSKISDYEDIERLTTYGFRGEALSSIAAVSQFEIKTRTKDEELGTLLKFEEQNIYTEKINCPVGTSIAVKNLFFNTPARRNFLKSDATELKHIVDVFKKIAISHPEIYFEFYNDDTKTYDLPPTDLNNRIIQLFGEQFVNNLFEINEKSFPLTVSGFIAKPRYLQKQKNEQYLFVNKRFVISKLVNSAVFTAFENLIEKSEYPFFVLFLEIDPKQIDINIHPSKLEIKFDDEKIIWVTINNIIKKSIAKYDLIPDVGLNDNTLDKSTQSLSFVSPSTSVTPLGNTLGGESKRASNYNPLLYQDKDKVIRKVDNSIIEQLFDGIRDTIDVKREPEIINHPFTDIAPVGSNIKEEYTPRKQQNDNNNFYIPEYLQIHNKYILCQIKTGLMIVDQHVAHERILYEKALKSLESGGISQQLLFPFEIELDPGDYEIVKELISDFKLLGFDIKMLPKNKIGIYGVPPDSLEGFEAGIFFSILEDIKNNIKKDAAFEKRHSIAASYACKTAIKTGQRLTENEMRYLVDELFSSTMPYVCPHGRPIIIKIALDEFDKKFGRI